LRVEGVGSAAAHCIRPLRQPSTEGEDEGEGEGEGEGGGQGQGQGQGDAENGSGSSDPAFAPAVYCPGRCLECF